VPRAEVFVTTKLWNADQGYDAALDALDEGLRTSWDPTHEP
jgi:2,5-diketo-D-gluconate reductase A